jgi:putative transcriptional regulator
MKSLQGHLLIASPKLPDQNFFRSVVLMIQHDEEGAFGLILNRPTGITIQEIWSKIGEGAVDCDLPMHLGGPVAGPLLALHARGDLSEGEVIAGVHFASQKEAINELVRSAEKRLMIFSGYSGWGGGQLDDELEAGGWLSMPAASEHVFDPPDDLWRKVVGDIGAEIIRPALKSRIQPADPTWN